MRMETNVIKVERTPSGKWALDVDNGPSLTCDKLIWAVGGTSSPIAPTWPKKNFTSPIIHSCQVGENLAVIEKIESAVVVGAAKSALDTVYMLLKAGKKVDWVSPPQCLILTARESIFLCSSGILEGHHARRTSPNQE
jgi:dimethylaniline monooxygenase (N-oxide forming)